MEAAVRCVPYLWLLSTLEHLLTLESPHLSTARANALCTSQTTMRGARRSLLGSVLIVPLTGSPVGLWPAPCFQFFFPLCSSSLHKCVFLPSKSHICCSHYESIMNILKENRAPGEDAGHRAACAGGPRSRGRASALSTLPATPHPRPAQQPPSQLVTKTERQQCSSTAAGSAWPQTTFSPRNSLSY